MIPSASQPAVSVPAEPAAGELSCYTAALALYLEDRCADPLARIARSVRLAVRPGLPGGLIAFSHHCLPLNDLTDGSHLVYRGTADRAAVPARLELELRTGLGVLVVAYTGTMAWSPASSEDSTPHFLLVRAHRGDSWLADDPFQALLPTGAQDPFTGWITTRELTEAMTPRSPLPPEHRLRRKHVFGFPVPLPPDDYFQWLSRSIRPHPDPVLPPGWLTRPCDALRFLSELWAALDRIPGQERVFDDMWASARHHAFRYAHLSRLPLAPPERALVGTACDLWQDLPMALRFAVASRARGQARPSLVRATFERLIQAETQVAALLKTYGYGLPQPAATDRASSATGTSQPSHPG